MLESKDGPVLKKESKISKYIDKYICPFTFISIGIFFMVYSMWLLYTDFIQISGISVFDLARIIIAPIFIIGVGFFAFFLGLVYFSWGNARYEFTKAGILVKYPLERMKEISWDEFQQVCICYTAYTTRGTPQRAFSVICFVKKR